MGEVAGVILWGCVLGKPSFGQGSPRGQQGEGPRPGGPGLELRPGELRAESSNGVSVGMICPKVKIRGHQGPHPLASSRAPQAVHRPGTPPPNICVSRGPGFGPPLPLLMGVGAPARRCPQGGVLAWRQVCRVLGCVVKAEKRQPMRRPISERPGKAGGWR